MFILGTSQKHREKTTFFKPGSGKRQNMLFFQIFFVHSQLPLFPGFSLPLLGTIPASPGVVLGPLFLVVSFKLCDCETTLPFFYNSQNVYFSGFPGQYSGCIHPWGDKLAFWRNGEENSY